MSGAESWSPKSRRTPIERHMWMRTPPVQAAHLQTQMDSQQDDMMMTRVTGFYVRRQACFEGGRLC